MYGYIHCCLESLVIRRQSLEAYKHLLRKAGLNEQLTEWKCHTNYPDDMTFRLFHSYAAITQQTIEAALEQFGEFFLTYAIEQKYDLLLKCQSTTLQGFLENLSSFHYFVDNVVFQGESNGPTFRCETNQDGTLTLHYFSYRKGLYPMVKGIIKQVAEELFHQQIQIVVRDRLEEKRRNIITEHVVFSISPIDSNDRLVQKPEKPLVLNRRKGVATGNISLQSFCKAFPTHICFNKQMFIEHCGSFIQEEFVIRRMTKLNDLFALIQPEDVPMSFKNFLTHLNSPFVFRAKHSLKRNEGKFVSIAFMLKGQMMLLNNGEHLLYMNSPYFSTVHELLASNVFISDFPIQDVTRDLILLNQNRIAQRELNRKLEEAVENIRLLTDELEQAKKQVDLMHADLLPPTISMLLCDDYVPAEEFFEVTFLNAEIPHFQLICAKLEPQELIDLMNELFKMYDKLIDLHGCLKVYSLLDSYFVANGAPEYKPNHYEAILNLALAMIYGTRTIIVPNLELPLLIRISIHSGSASGMVTGTSRLKYTVISESVDITKQLNSHGEAGKILVTSMVKALASKSDVYSFQNFSYIKLSKNSSQATCTFWLEKHNFKSVSELTGMEEVGDFDPQAIESEQLAWNNYYRQNLGLKTLTKDKKSSLFWRRIKENNFKSNGSQDSGISYETISSSTCSIQ